jgi:hypothetical protein
MAKPRRKKPKPTRQKRERGALNERQQRFVEAYVGEAAGNGAEAVRMAGYASRTPHLASVRAVELLSHPVIRRAIDEQLARIRVEAQLTVEECHTILAELARSAAIEPKDRIAAVDKVLKARGAYVTKLEHSGAVEAVITLSPEIEAALDEWLLIRSDPRVQAVIAEVRG